MFGITGKFTKDVKGLATRCWSLVFALSCAAPTPPPRSPESPAAPAPAPAAPAPSPSPLGARLVMNALGAPSGRSGHVSLVVGSQLFIVSGQNSAFHLADGGLYDPAADSWRPLVLPGNTSGRFLAAGAAGQAGGQAAAFIWGGSQFVSVTQMKGTRLGDGAVYFPQSNSWDTIDVTASSPIPRSNHCGVFGAGLFIVWGGESYGVPLADGGLYDPAAKSWRPIPNSQPGSFPGPGARQGMACFWDEGTRRMLMYGGFSGVNYDDLWSFDPLTMSWTQLNVRGAPLIPRLYPTVGFGGGYLLVYGGSDGPALRSGTVIDLGTLTASAAASDGGPYETIDDDLTAAWDGSGFVLAGKTADRTANAALRLAVGGHGDSVTSSWQLLSSSLDPLGESPQVGLSVRRAGRDTLLWGGRDANGSMNGRGLRFVPAAATSD